MDFTNLLRGSLERFSQKVPGRIKIKELRSAHFLWLTLVVKIGRTSRPLSQCDFGTHPTGMGGLLA
jgi:hypothetical protein